MKKLLPLFILMIACVSANAQWEKEKQQLKSILTEAMESLSQPTRQWFVDVTEQQPGDAFDWSYAKGKLAQKFGGGVDNEMAEMFVVMMNYLKMVQKEARQDRKIERESRRLALASKEEKMRMQQETIDQGMREAREKAEAAMDAAVTQLITSMVSAAIQIAAATVGFGTKPTSKVPTRIDSIKLKLIDPAKFTQQQKKEMVAEYLKKLQSQLNTLKKNGA